MHGAALIVGNVSGFGTKYHARGALDAVAGLGLSVEIQKVNSDEAGVSRGAGMRSRVWIVIEKTVVWREAATYLASPFVMLSPG